MTEKCATVKCSLTAKAVLMWLAHHYNDETGRCDPSTETVAREACTTSRTVRNALSELMEIGILSVDHRTGKSSNYKFNPGTWFRPETNAPRNVVPPTPEPDSAPPRNVVPQPRNVVPPNSKEQEEEQEKNRKRKKTILDFEMPDPPFASPEFLTAWEDWQEFRRSKRKPHTPVSIKYQFSDFKKWGEEKAIESIKNSIKSGYQGLFEPKTVLKTANGRTLEIYTGEAVR